MHFRLEDKWLRSIPSVNLVASSYGRVTEQPVLRAQRFIAGAKPQVPHD
jgi:hypothetical protein